MSEKSVGLYGTDEIAKGLQTIVEVVADIKAAKAEDSAKGKKITTMEAATIAVGNVGKLFNFANSIDEMGKEAADLEVKEAPEICAALEKLYSPENPFIKAGSEKLVAAVLGVKEAVELFLQAKEWEKTN